MHIRPHLLAAASLALVLGLALSGCAGPPRPASAEAQDFDDPFEGTNRAIFGFNQVVDRNVLVPVAKTYRTVLPEPVRESVHDFLQNLDDPVIFANDALQGEFGLAGNTLARFALNTTIGIGGLFDVATRVGIPRHSNDLGVTFAEWGVPDGPYLVLPVMGPSNPRDLVGEVGDGFADPGNIIASEHHRIWASFARALVAGIDERSRNIETLADIERTSIDYYATIRSLYRQRRASQIRHEQQDMPNPAPVAGSDTAPVPAMSYSIAEAPSLSPSLPEVPLR